VSFILDALRKSEHERQRSALPGLAQIPLATAPSQLPRWALLVIGTLAAAVLVLAGAWWQSTRAPAPVATVAPAAMIERSVMLPPPASIPAATAASVPPPAVATPAPFTRPLAAASVAAPNVAPASRSAADDEPALPSAAALAAQGMALPPLRLELHAFSEQPSDRFVFINGRKYVEGERLPEGPELVSITPSGAVLSQYGRRFLLVPE